MRNSYKLLEQLAANLNNQSAPEPDQMTQVTGARLQPKAGELHIVWNKCQHGKPVRKCPTCWNASVPKNS